MTAKLIATVGLQGSGKSYWARKYLENSHVGDTIIVEKDQLRKMMHDGVFKQGVTEPQIIAARDALISLFLRQGKTVISSDTNLNPVHIKQLEDLAKQHNADFVIQDFTDVPIETCIQRDLKRFDSVGEKVIRDTYNKYLRKTEVYDHNPDLPDAIIVDIDGTLALNTGGRSFYDLTRIHEDTVNGDVANLVREYHSAGYKIIIFSGRDDTAMNDTGTWLDEYAIPFDHIYMRVATDKRKDNIIKRELFDAHVKDQYNVHFVLDDRNQVVEMWRDLGLTCLQVAEGDF